MTDPMIEKLEAIIRDHLESTCTNPMHERFQAAEELRAIFSEVREAGKPQAPWMSSPHRDQTEAIAKGGLAPSPASAGTEGPGLREALEYCIPFLEFDDDGERRASSKTLKALVAIKNALAALARVEGEKK